MPSSQTYADGWRTRFQLNHAAAVALYTLHYNFARQHKGLSNPYPRTRPEAAGIADHIWTCEAIAALLD